MLGWTRPSHPGWAETSSARVSLVGQIDGPTNLFLGGLGLQHVQSG
jgi:hypothetical protein